MLNNERLRDLYLNPDVSPDQYEEVRIVTIKSEYARLMWEIAMERVGISSVNVIAEIERMLESNEIQLCEHVIRDPDSSCILTAYINAENVNDEDTWLKAVSLVSKAIDFFQVNPSKTMAAFGKAIPLHRKDLPWFGYH